MKSSPNDPLKTRPSLIDEIRNLENDEAWSEFVRIYRPLIVRVGLSWRLSSDDAEDVAQKTLAWVVKKIQDFEYRPETCRFRTWLFQKVRHLITDCFLEREKKNPAVSLDQDEGSEGTAPAAVCDPNSLEWEKRWEEEHKRAILDAASQMVRRRLPLKYFQAFDMFKLQDQSVELVAEKLGVTPDYVHLASHRFKEALKREVARLQRDYD
jgi:RNA polymerase sigma-70 factor (ECF subfamily)